MNYAIENIAVSAAYGGILTFNLKLLKPKSGSPDADMTAEHAAKIFVRWLPKIRQERNFGYIQAGAEELPF